MKKDVCPDCGNKQVERFVESDFDLFSVCSKINGAFTCPWCGFEKKLSFEETLEKGVFIKWRQVVI